ncbi:LOW QUALITY PROTEIN: uncharacterized protein EMH_0022250 [Eimeria mitis]|uniref:Uncharacterized protein n=1 Tax=Eimeria mitis TaxID=44415 RepID=U6K9U3_9EIME|nr:LOW QUALITY PROTEIN: uncharacterized protein EMH_0022250 [Eimeria mitis]CDJ34800.1 hypothetical protein, conserved [Eimeria mitis]
MLLSLFLPFLPSACTPRPPSLRLRRWQLVRLPRRGRQRRLGSSVEQGTSNNSSCCSGLPRQLQQPQLQQHPVKDSNPRKPETNEEIAVQVPECLTNSLALFLIHLKLQRAVQNTLSQTEILALCLLARERRQRLPPSTPTATKAKPIADKVAHSSAEGQAPCFANGGTPCFTDGRYPCSADGCSGSPSQQCRGPTCASLPSAFATAVGGRRFRIDPLDVCVLLASQRLQLDDLSLLDDLESVAAETEAAHEKENKWWRWATMLGINRTRGDIWKSAAAKLQQQQQKQEQQQHHRLVRRRRKKSLVAEESLPPFPVLATSPCSAAAANNKNNNIKKTALGAPAVTLSASAAAESGFAPLRGPGSMQLGLCPDAAATAGAPEAPGRFPTGASLEALSPASRHWGDCTSLRGPGAPSFHPFRSDEAGAEAPASAVGEPAAAAGNEAAAAAAGEAAAAAVARLSRNCLALLGHSCQWPLAASCTGGPRALVSDPAGGSPRASQGPPSLGEDWKSAVGFREGRRGSSSRRRVTLRRRQRLSPLDPPYDAHALLLHPFCAAPAAALPDAETARAAEVHEVALDFLSRTKGTQGCPQCIRGEPRKGDKQNPTNASPCPHHQRLHYTKVGEHGACLPDPLVPTTSACTTPKSAEAILRDLILENKFTSVHLVRREATKTADNAGDLESGILMLAILLGGWLLQSYVKFYLLAL